MVPAVGPGVRDQAAEVGTDDQSSVQQMGEQQGVMDVGGRRDRGQGQAVGIDGDVVIGCAAPALLRSLSWCPACRDRSGSARRDRRPAWREQCNCPPRQRPTCRWRSVRPALSGSGGHGPGAKRPWTTTRPGADARSRRKRGRARPAVHAIARLCAGQTAGW